MHVTLLQPLLILAAIAIVGGVPLLGAVAPAAAVGASSTVARGAGSTQACAREVSLARRRKSHRTSDAARQPRAALRDASRTSTELAWAVRRSTCALPPPGA